ncbi:MAG: hypothetical protein WCN98_12210 [Verrucomicrobiaceae bacterium]
MKTRSIAILIAGFCLGSSVSLRAEAPPPPDNDAKQDKAPAANLQHYGAEMFNKMDSNGDGKISREEFMKSAEERFSKFDGNKDGILEKNDVPAKIQERAARKGRPQKAEGKGEQKITKAAFMKMNAERFDKMDTNNDGFVDKSEFEASLKNIREHLGTPAHPGPRKRS